MDAEPMDVMKPLHLRLLESDHSRMMRTRGLEDMEQMKAHVAARLECIENKLLPLLNGSVSSEEVGTDPLVHLTEDISVPTSAFLPHAIEGVAADFSMADLCSWALVCSSWAGWVRRLLRDPTALRWMWYRLLLGHINELDLGYVRHPELATRSCYRATLMEQAHRDAGLVRRAPGEPPRPPEVLACDVAGGLADVWAYLANSYYHEDRSVHYHDFCYNEYRPHPQDPFPFLPFVNADGTLPLEDTGRTESHPNNTFLHWAERKYEAGEEVAYVTDLIVNMFDLINQYTSWVKREHDPDRNLKLSVVLLPTLETAYSQLFRFLQIGHFSSEAEFRAQITEAKVNKFRAMLKDYAYFFPQKAEVMGTYHDDPEEGDLVGKPIHAGRLEEVLEEVMEPSWSHVDDDDDDGGDLRMIRFQTMVPMGEAAMFAQAGVDPMDL